MYNQRVVYTYFLNILLDEGSQEVSLTQPIVTLFTNPMITKLQLNAGRAAHRCSIAH
jgi:hypothetical protein